MQSASSPPLPIGELLLARGLIAEQDIEKALAYQRQFKGRFGAILVRIGALSEDVLLPVLAEQLGMPLLDRDGMPGAEAIQAAIATSELAEGWFHDQRALVWEAAEGVIQCASRNPTDSNLQETLLAAFPQHRLLWSLARTHDIEEALKAIQPRDAGPQQDEIAHLRELAEEAPVVELVNNVLSQATDDAASDIHLEPEERTFGVRFRIDGVLHRRMTLPRERFNAVSSRIKLISNMDIAERRLPQDGRLNLELGGQRFDVRIATIPSVNGESVSLRLLGRERLDLAGLGMDAALEARIRALLAMPNGIILVTGPTGCGKSSTLYTFLRELNTKERRIVTIEDPVENKLDGVVQIAVKPEINLTFAAGLRSILRGDPNVIMVGEMRDLETTEIAIRGALTGHLVFSTLHTNDAVGGISRLLDMGIEPFLIASSVRAFLAQRLVRRLCPHCAKPGAEYHDHYLRSVGFPVEEKHRIRVPVGCRECRGTGYRGRLAIIEICAISPAIQELIADRAPSISLRTKAIEEGMIPMRDDGWKKVISGETTLEEVIAVTAAEHSP